MSKKKTKKTVKSASKVKHRFPKAAVEDTEMPAVEVAAEEGESDELVLEFAEEENVAEELEFIVTESDGEVEIEDASESEEESIEILSALAEDSVSEELPEGESVEASEAMEASEVMENAEAIEGTELADFDSAIIEDVEHLTSEQARSIVESVLFSTDKPMSIAVIKQAFKGTNIKSKDIRECLESLIEDYKNSNRGFSLSEIGGGFQLRTKPENLKYLRQSVKARPFRLSGPALEVLSIVAYKQPTTKAQIDEIRGVESGHLLRALMEKGILNFGERSDLPGKPMFYETTRKFLEIFGLRNIQELPSLHEIDQLMPEGIGEDEKKETLSDVTEQMSTAVTDGSYSVGEDELLKITDELSQITTSSDFFEQEKERMREKRDQERAQDIRERQLVGETVEDKDLRWLERYDAAKLAAVQGTQEVAFVTDGILGESGGVPGETVDVVESEADPEEVLQAEASELIGETEELDLSDEELEREPVTEL